MAVFKLLSKEFFRSQFIFLVICLSYWFKEPFKEPEVFLVDVDFFNIIDLKTKQPTLGFRRT